MTTKHEEALITKYDLLFESRLTRVETTCDALLRAESRIEERMTRLEDRMVTILRTMVIGFVSVAGLIAKVAHWV